MSTGTAPDAPGRFAVRSPHSTQNVGLTRERIVDAALRLMDEHGVGEFTTRRLAAELGVRAPTLYWHFPSKQALEDACVEAVLGVLELPETDAGAGGWADGVRVLMASVRDQLGRHPSVIALMGRSHPPSVGRVSTEGLHLMRAAGLDWPDAFLFCRLMIWRIVGFTSMEHTLRTSSEVHTVERAQPDRHRPTRFRLRETWPPGAPDEVQALSTAVDLDAMFRADIEVFVAGVEARARARQPG